MVESLSCFIEQLVTDIRVSEACRGVVVPEAAERCFCRYFLSQNAAIVNTVSDSWNADNAVFRQIICCCTKFGQLVLGENHWNCCQQTLDFKAKMHQIRFQPGFWPKPYWNWKSLQRSPSLPGWIKGGLLLREGREGDGEGKGRTGGAFRQINIHPWSVWLISSNGVSVFSLSCHNQRCCLSRLLTSVVNSCSCWLHAFMILSLSSSCTDVVWKHLWTKIAYIAACRLILYSCWVGCGFWFSGSVIYSRMWPLFWPFRCVRVLTFHCSLFNLCSFVVSTSK